MPEMPTKIRVLVADDEPLARRGVRQLLAPHGDIVVAGESRNGPETLRALEALAPDLLFLDIQMPEMDGFEVLRARGPERMPAVIFVTAHDQFAVQAFEAHALDYLVKPLNVGRFETALQRVRERFRLRRSIGSAPTIIMPACISAPMTICCASRCRRSKGGWMRAALRGFTGRPLFNS